jgi:16S rRNA (guanine527-N7)-methyltransferase
VDTAKIAELLKPFVPAGALDEADLNRISTYIDILLRWNARMNLTAVRDPEQIVRRHFGESLFAASRLLPEPLRHARLFAIDVGSGAGFPGIPLKVWAPNLDTTLVESQNRKAIFLREVIRALTLTHINVHSGRAEDYKVTADLVTLRAVEKFEAVLPVAAALVRLHGPGQSVGASDIGTSGSAQSNAPEKYSGRLALLIGAAQIPRAKELLPAEAWRWDKPLPIPESTARVLLVGYRPPAAKHAD